MKRLNKHPYLQNIVTAWHRQHGHGAVVPLGTKEYRDYLRTLGFNIPVRGDWLEFPDDFSEQELLLFRLKWS